MRSDALALPSAAVSPPSQDAQPRPERRVLLPGGGDSLDLLRGAVRLDGDLVVEGRQRDRDLPADVPSRESGSSENYPDAWSRVPFLNFYINSIIVTGLATFGQTVTATLVAYGFARFRFPLEGPAVHAGPLDADGAVGGDDRPELPAVPDARLAGHALAADRAALVRRRAVLHLPAAPVLHDDPARLRRGGQDRRRQLAASAVGDPGAALPPGRSRRWRSSRRCSTGTRSSSR